MLKMILRCLWKVNIDVRYPKDNCLSFGYLFSIFNIKYEY